MGLKEIPDDYVVPKSMKKTGESKRMIETMEKYSQAQEKERFFQLHYRYFDDIIALGDSFSLYLYMCKNITRKIGGWQFWDNKILPYYKAKYLPFAKHQRKMAEELGVHQSTISRRLSLLEEKEMIFEIGKEQSSEDSYMTVYSLGRWGYDSNGAYREYFYLQTFNYFT